MVLTRTGISRISNRNARTCPELQEPYKTIYYVQCFIHIFHAKDMHLSNAISSPWKLKNSAWNLSNLDIVYTRESSLDPFGILNDIYVTRICWFPINIVVIYIDTVKYKMSNQKRKIFGIKKRTIFILFYLWLLRRVVKGRRTKIFSF